MKPARAEEQLITLLSKVVQWMYDFLGTKTVGSAFLLNGFFAASVSLISASIFACINDKQVGLNIILFGTISIALLVNVVLMCCIAVYFASNLMLYNTIDIISNTSLQPNPNKYTSWLAFCRMSIPCFFFASIIQTSDFGSLVFVLIVALCFLGVTIAMYTLCVDKPTPKHKEEIKKNLSFALEGQ